MPRFFVTPDKVIDNRIIIDNADVKHLKVLRLGVNDTIEVCDSTAMLYNVRIIEINSKEVICSIESSSKINTEPPIEVTLYQGVPKASKMDYIIQKTTELGISKIVPVDMERSVAKIKNDSKKIDRWNKIAEEAAKQSGRGIIPQVLEAIDFNTAIKQFLDYDLVFAPYECENQMSLKKLISGSKAIKIAYIIGPEGGFDNKEIDKLKNINIPTITLGPRILRTETAGEAVLSMLMYELGDVNV